MALALMGASLPADQAVLQRQLDFMVAACRAERVVRLVAHGRHDVELQMVQPNRIPTVSENTVLQCALGKVRARDDLRLGLPGIGR